MAANKTVEEKQTLAELEEVIQRGLETFIEVGEALARVRDERLYKAAGYESFARYCKERWDLGRSDVYHLIGAAEVRAIVPVTNEAQARELAPLLDDPDKLRAVWEETLDRTDGHPTAKAIAETRDGPGHSQSPSDPGYHYYVPPIEWTSYLEQQGLTKAEISGCMRAALMQTGPEEALRLWDESGRAAS